WTMSRLRRVTDPSLRARTNYRAGVFSLRRVLALLALLLGLAKLCACSVLLDTQIRQCQSNADCSRFGDSICDPDQQLCVPRPASVKAGDGGPVSPSGAAGD